MILAQLRFNETVVRDLMQHCDICEANSVMVHHREESFVYGSGHEQVVLSAVVPVYECGECGEMHTGQEAEELRHEAVCKHLGRLTPREIKMIRESYGLTQEKFANVSGFGVASIKRWELGNQIQGVSANNLLVLLGMPSNLRHVQAVNQGEASLPEPFREPTATERKLVDITFQIGLMAAERMHGKSTKEVAEWIASQLNACGFQNTPVGSSWGYLTGVEE